MTRMNLLKVLLKQRHLQSHRTFCKEYDKIAAEVDPDLKGRGPSKAQFYRWLSGELIGLPHADHCRILEAMLPDWTVEQLFQPYEENLRFIPERTNAPVSPRDNTPESPRVEIDESPEGQPAVISAIMQPSLSESDDTIVVPARTADGEVVFVSVSRRLFLQGVGSAAVGIATSAGLEMPNSSIPMSTSVSLDASPIEHFRQMRQVLIDSDNMFGPRQVIPTVREQVNLMQRLRHGTRGADQRDLMLMQTQFAEFCSWLYQDAGDHQAAQYWTDRALEWSYIARDHELTVFILARKAQLAGDMRQGNEAVDVAEAALSMAPAGSRLAAVAATFAAHGYSLDGNRDETMRAYDQARSLLHAVEPTRPTLWGGWLDEPYIAVHQAHSLSVLGDYPAAANGFQTAIDALPPSYKRDRGVYLARSAVANAGGHEAERAASLGLSALTVATETGSERIMKELVYLRDILPESSTAIEIGNFRAAMDDVLAHQD